MPADEHFLIFPLHARSPTSGSLYLIFNFYESAGKKKSHLEMRAHSAYLFTSGLSPAAAGSPAPATPLPMRGRPPALRMNSILLRVRIEFSLSVLSWWTHRLLPFVVGFEANAAGRLEQRPLCRTDFSSSCLLTVEELFVS